MTAERDRPIAYVLAEFPSLSETFVLREILAVIDHGIAVELFALRPGTAAKTHGAAAPLVVRVHRPPRPGSLAGLAGVAGMLRRRPRRFAAALRDVVQTTGRTPRALAAALRRLPTACAFAARMESLGVGHIHAHFLHLPADVGRMAAILLGISHSVGAHAWDIYAQPAGLVRRRLAAAAFVATCTRANRDALARLGGGSVADNLVLAYHGVDAAGREPRPPPGSTILAIGRLEAKKGFDVLVDACQRLAERGAAPPCVIVGEGPERERLEARIARAGLGRQVTLAGPLTQEELEPLFQQAAALAAPSVVAASGDRDGLPNVLLEALAAGVPVVASDLPANRELIVDGDSGILTPPGDAEALAAALARVFADPAAAAALAAAGRQRVLADFDNARNVEPLVERFRRAVERAGAAAAGEPP